MAMKCSIRNSCLLIAFLYRTHKHQLGDFFNSHISFHYVIRGKVKRESPEQLQAKITATVSSGNMRPRKTVKTIAELTN
jgi:hypothetical protein